MNRYILLLAIVLLLATVIMARVANLNLDASSHGHGPRNVRDSMGQVIKEKPVSIPKKTKITEPSNLTIHKPYTNDNAPRTSSVFLQPSIYLKRVMIYCPLSS